MKMIIAIIGSEDADDLVYELNQHSFFVTKLSTMGGFLKKKSTTLMLGVEDERVEDAISIIKKMSGAREQLVYTPPDRKSTRLNSSHVALSRMPSSA